LGHFITPERTAAGPLKEETVAVSSKFTTIPKTYELMAEGVPPQVVATYTALADFANNTTGLCWPRMDTLARTLSRTPRTIQYHLHLLKELGLIEFVERRRDKRGRFMSWVYKITHVAQAAQRMKERREKNKAAYEERKRKQKEEREQKRKRRLSKKPTTGNSSPMGLYIGLTSSINDLPPNPPRDKNNLIEGYWRSFGEEAPPGAQEEWDKRQAERREEEARRRIEGYEWFFSERGEGL
jgi:predicted transcriptional regulator